MNARAWRLSLSRTKYSSRPQYIIRIPVHPRPCRAPEAGPTGAGTWVPKSRQEAGAIPDSQHEFAT